MRRALSIASVAVLVAACTSASTGVGTLRFKNQDPVVAVNDRLHTPERPAENPFPKNLYHFDGHVHRRITRWMEMRGSLRAANVNSMDEVPNSTWFTNRIGVRDMSLQEIKNGPGDGTGSPESHRPWTIVSSKVGGVSVGFIIKDARGERYLLKFDMKGEPESDTAADVIISRLLHAVGYNVPEDYVVYFHREDLKLAPDAKVKDPFGNKSPLTEKLLNSQLAKVNIEKDGRIRGLVSKFISGKPLGGTIRDWTREDDPNDTLPHYLRRELRGQYSVFSWLEHTDIKEDNTLDVYTDDPVNPDVKYVKHYLLDFGNALGVQGRINKRKFMGHAHELDFAEIAKSLFTLGIYKRPWEDRELPPRLKGVGLFAVRDYDPGAWKTYTPSYFQFHDTDKFDAFWGAKIVIRFTPAQIRAAVEEARYTDPRSAEYIIKTLVERQRKTARYWFEKVNPLDAFEVTGSGSGYRVCFDDLMIRYDLDYVSKTTTYDIVAYDRRGRETGWAQRSVRPDDSGRACVQGLAPSSSKDGYTILKISTVRERRDRLAPTLVHLAENSAGKLRVIGLRRQ